MLERALQQVLRNHHASSGRVGAEKKKNDVTRALQRGLVSKSHGVPWKTVCYNKESLYNAPDTHINEQRLDEHS